MDFEQIERLLTICNLAKGWPSLNPIHDLAMAELVDLNAEAVKELTDQREAKAGADKKAQADKVAEIEARAKTDAKAQAKLAVPQPKDDPSLQQQTTDGRRSENVTESSIERKV